MQSWAIGLRSYDGVYQWRPNETSLTYDNFSSMFNTDMNGECVYMEMGSPYYGQWITTSCLDMNGLHPEGLFAICERSKM